MKHDKINAVGYFQNLPISHEQALIDLEIEMPILVLPHDILVRVHAISVNPVDFKIRRYAKPQQNQHKILGWDVAGVVERVGEKVNDFKVGDEVYYAGDIMRPGGNSNFHLVDARIVGKKPKSLSFEQASALPLTAITAWEIIFDRLNILNDVSNGSILVVGGAGGVGSMAIQLLKKLTNLQIIATASRPETISWVQALGAHAIINHKEPLVAQIEKLEAPPVKYIISTVASDFYAQQFVEVINPQGQIALIDDPESFDVVPFKRKSVSIHWELMFTRSIFQTEDMNKQSVLLNRISQLIDEGVLVTTQRLSLGAINAHNLRKAHAILESGTSIGKITLG